MSAAFDAVLAGRAFDFILASKAKIAAKKKRNAIRCPGESDKTPPCWRSGTEKSGYCDACKERDRVHAEEFLTASRKRTAALRKLMTFGPKTYSYPK